MEMTVEQCSSRALHAPSKECFAAMDLEVVQNVILGISEPDQLSI
jgi:hypothetical protein